MFNRVILFHHTSSQREQGGARDERRLPHYLKHAPARRNPLLLQHPLFLQLVRHSTAFCLNYIYLYQVQGSSGCELSDLNPAFVNKMRSENFALHSITITGIISIHHPNELQKEKPMHFQLTKDMALGKRI